MQIFDVVQMFPTTLKTMCTYGKINQNISILTAVGANLDFVVFNSTCNSLMIQIIWLDEKIFVMNFLSSQTFLNDSNNKVKQFYLADDFHFYEPKSYSDLRTILRTVRNHLENHNNHTAMCLKALQNPLATKQKWQPSMLKLILIDTILRKHSDRIILSKNSKIPYSQSF